ncbi:MAG: Gfo/Idh/MocA family oxidoreductase [Cyclobacteriaceae bacterium]|nr:Gfo/Idh/MocA family oxidoreductase [Cyclobacteriaceae bacterium]
MAIKTRRDFLKKTGTGLLAATMPAIASADPKNTQIIEDLQKNAGPNDKIRLAVVGMGIMGYNNLAAAVKVPGVEFVAACDLYDGRLTRAKELYGDNIATTRNYRELLDRKDIDAICVATSDHWHDRITIDALNKGKSVYCEKPMVHKIEEGYAVIEAEKKSGKTLQVGSQRASSILYHKAAELYKSGAIGQLIIAEANTDRFSANGAWQYSIPTDASEKTVDWKGFLGDAPVRDFDPLRFFRWRNYQDYGTGVAGDLFVHLFTGLHVVLGSQGPNRIFASGGLRFWKDGRDVPDVMLAVVDYPQTASHAAFNLQIRVNFVDSGGGSNLLRLIGTEGTMELGWGQIIIKKNKLDDAPGYGGWDSYETFSSAQQKEYEKWYKAKYPVNYAMKDPGEQIYQTPDGYDDNVAHWTSFINGIRTGAKVTEDGSFGLRSAGPSLATNLSYFGNKVINWDPVKMAVIS